MSYITMNGEVRTTVSVRLTDAELDALDACRFAIARERAEMARAEVLPNTARMWEEEANGPTPPRRVKRSDALRWLIARAS